MSSFIHKICQGIYNHVVLLGKLLSLDYAKSIIIPLMRAGLKQSTWGSVVTWESLLSTVIGKCCDSAEQKNPQVRVLNSNLKWKRGAVTAKRWGEGLHGKWELSLPNGDSSGMAGRFASFHLLPYFL